MKIMSLDLATQTGWAVGTPDGLPRVGTYRLPKSWDPDDFGKRFFDFDQWLGGMLDLEQPDQLGYEAPIVVGGKKGTTRATNQHTVRLLHGLCAITEKVAASRGVPCYELHIQTTRKHFAGHGFADKGDVEVVCMNRGVMVANGDEADAVAGLSYLQHGFNCPAAWATEIPVRGTLPPPSERAALRKAVR